MRVAPHRAADYVERHGIGGAWVLAHLDIDGVVAIRCHRCQGGRDKEIQGVAGVRADIIRVW